MTYTPFAQAKPLQKTRPASGYTGYSGYNPPPEPPGDCELPERVAVVANVAAHGKGVACPLEAYLRAMNSPEALVLPGLPPTPYSAAPAEVWQDMALHGAAWAAWWAAVSRKR